MNAACDKLGIRRDVQKNAFKIELARKNFRKFTCGFLIQVFSSAQVIPIKDVFLYKNKRNSMNKFNSYIRLSIWNYINIKGNLFRSKKNKSNNLCLRAKKFKYVKRE